MSKYRFRAALDDGLFGVLIIAAAVASAALEGGALLGAWPSAGAPAIAHAAPPGAPRGALAAASAPAPTLVSAALARSAP